VIGGATGNGRAKNSARRVHCFALPCARAGFEPRPIARHASKPYANRTLGIGGTFGKINRTERLKTGAGKLNPANHILGAPSFSPYRRSVCMGEENCERRTLRIRLRRKTYLLSS
jgi:hypothetical protein